MGLGRWMGFFVIIPASVLLSISFFVLFAIRKAASKDLKRFGYVVASFLWISVLLLIFAGSHILITGKYPFNRTMHMMSRAYASGWHMKMFQEMHGQDQMAGGKEKKATFPCPKEKFQR